MNHETTITQRWHKVLGRWVLGPAVDPLAEVTVLGRRDVSYTVRPHSPNPVSKRGLASVDVAKTEAEKVLADLTPSEASHNVTPAVEGTPEQQHLENVAHRAQALAVAREAFETALTAARRDRVALRKIAGAAGLSHEQVRRLTESEGS